MNAAAFEPARIALMLNELRLPTIGRLWPEFAERSDKEGWPASRFLAALLEHELAERAKRRIERHRAESQLDPTKTLASFDFAAVPMLSKAHVMALASGDAWLEKGATILIFGPPGVGKSHVGCGIGHALIDAGYRVLYMRTSELVQRLQAARQNLQLPQALTKLDRYDLLILDDLSYVRKDQAETSVLFELIAEALRAAQHPHHRQPAVLRLGQRVPRSGHDGSRHRPPGPPLDDLRAPSGRELSRQRGRSPTKDSARQREEERQARASNRRYRMTLHRSSRAHTAFWLPHGGAARCFGRQSPQRQHRRQRTSANHRSHDMNH